MILPRTGYWNIHTGKYFVWERLCFLSRITIFCKVTSRQKYYNNQLEDGGTEVDF
jgi:hypothetical protein